MKFDDFPAKTLMEITTRPPLVFARGEGSGLWDHEGNARQIVNEALRPSLSRLP